LLINPTSSALVNAPELLLITSLTRASASALPAVTSTLNSATLDGPVTLVTPVTPAAPAACSAVTRRAGVVRPCSRRRPAAGCPKLATHAST
jgi:hypothetical protein